MKYNSFISLGYFCSVAIDLDRINRRDKSYPFDWLITDIKSVEKCIENKFHDFLEEDLLYRDDTYDYIVHNKKFQIDFYHDFKPGIEIREQLPSVKEKYERRINRFYKTICKPTLFIRYIKDDEINYWYNDASKIINLIKRYNRNNVVLLIVNTEVSVKRDSLVEGVLATFYVKKDSNDTVARKIVETNPEIKKYLIDTKYSKYNILKIVLKKKYFRLLKKLSIKR